MGKPMSLIRLNQQTSYPLHSLAATRRIEQAAAAQLAPHTLMQRAGLEAAMHLKLWGRNPVVTWLGDEARCPADALLSLHRARQAGVTFAADTWSTANTLTASELVKLT